MNPVLANLSYLCKGGYRFPDGHRPPAGHAVPPDFMGICVAASPAPDSDAYLIQQLTEMGLNHVRLDYTYGSGETHTARFLESLLSASFRVLLHFVQPLDEARRMQDPAAQDRWRAFVAETLERWGDRIEAVEAGSTVNRRKWAGYTIDTFLTAWRIVCAESRKRSIRLAGPNVTDFEPIYNVALLARMKQDATLPDIHTDNLFVERATEPEAYDPKIMGRFCAPLVKYNLIKKARLLQRISTDHAVTAFWSTHVAWSRRRIARILADTEGKQADYLARYGVLAAASGAVQRVYWGPLVGQREGVIDDGTDEYPEPIPHVTLYNCARGRTAQYRVRPARAALKTFIEQIPGKQYQGRLAGAAGVEVHSFTGGGELVHVAWTRDGCGAEWDPLYRAEDLAEAAWTGRDGERLTERPPLVTESPCYLSWPADRTVTVREPARPLPEWVMPPLSGRHQVYRVEEKDWQGAVLAGDRAERDHLLQALGPARLGQTEARSVLREARNRVWTVPDPRDEKTTWVVKRGKVTRWYRKLLDAHKPSKARRSWNGACELLRRGIPTPEPVAFFEAQQHAALGEHFYLCALAPHPLSVRSFFTAYAQGCPAYQGVEAPAFYQAVAEFVVRLHRCGVFYRDLSAGNLLVAVQEQGTIDFTLIDTARARFYTHPVTARQRLSDLKRLCHPLHWAGRRAFVGLYLELVGTTFTWEKQLPFLLYDLKHAFKKKGKKVFRQGKRI